MKRVLSYWSILVFLAGAALSPLACEGEPPATAPENPPGRATAAPLAQAQAVQPAPPPSPTVVAAVGPPPANELATSPDGMVSAAPTSEEVVSPGPSPSDRPSPIPPGNIVGTVSTKPAAVSGQAVVYLEDGPKEDESPAQTVTVANRRMTFVPFVTVASTGGKVVFTNDDPFPHNVFSPDNDKFNLGSMPQHGVHARTFENPGAYTLLCNLHPGMIGYLVITPSTWFARTDPKGKFRMNHVPSGTYRITAWAPRQAPVTQEVTVAEGDVEIHFDLHR